MIKERRSWRSRRWTPRFAVWVSMSRALVWVGLALFVGAIVANGAPVWVLAISAAALLFCYWTPRGSRRRD